MVTHPKSASLAHNKTQEPRIIAGGALAGRAMVHTSLSGRDSEINSHQALKSTSTICRRYATSVGGSGVAQPLTNVDVECSPRIGSVGRVDARPLSACRNL